MDERSREDVEVARLLRGLAAELLAASGPTRNGLFLELHRLHDTLFRHTLAHHPDASPEIAAQAFAVADALPAPQVLRLLNDLGAPLAASEIRSLYKHMNAARNNMAHEAVLARVEVSRSNAKRMARLAHLVADELDPDQRGQPDAATTPPAPPARWPRQLLYLGSGAAGGLVGGWIGWGEAPPALAMAAAILVLTLVGGLLLLDEGPPGG